MKFISFNYANGDCIVICLDDITIFRNDGEHDTLIFVRNRFDKPYRFGRDIEHVLSQVFSDIDGGEYQIVEIHENDNEGPGVVEYAQVPS